jgi:pyruvate-formate lyase
MNTTHERPVADARMQALIARRDRLALEGRRNLYMDSLLHGVYQWSKGSASFSPETGTMAVAATQRINLGDHNCRVGVGQPFPHVAEMPSARHGLTHDPLNWAADFAFFIGHSPAEINPGERIVGEFHWQLDEARELAYPAEIDAYGERAMEAGAGGSSLTHTCPNLEYGLRQGWRGILERVRAAKTNAQVAAVPERLRYLEAAEMVCHAIMGYIRAHAQRARELAAQEPDSSYALVADTCAAIVEDPPQTFHQAVQWMQFFQVCERMNGHGNGYGRLDQFLLPFYREDLRQGRITPEEARDLVAEFYLKYGGNYFSVGGRDAQLRDATNELSWRCVEAYDLVGGYNCMGVLWHADIDQDFYGYACEVVHRHRCGTPALVNYDAMRLSEIRSGVREQDAWNVSYSGCQWYCIVGREYCDQDKNVIVLLQCFNAALRRAAEGPEPDSFERFYALLLEEIHRAADALVALKDMQYQHQARVWPEIVSSFLFDGCIENGLDITERAVPGHYYFTSVNLLGFTNVVDSLYSIAELIFARRQLDFRTLRQALQANFHGYEALRKQILALPKYGNDTDAVDAIARRFADDIELLLRGKRNCKGFHLRPSLFQFMGHSIAGPLLGAGADGRTGEEPLAQGFNPSHGKNQQGFTATAASLLKVDQTRFIGAPWQCELVPSFFAGPTPPGLLLRALSQTYFKAGGIQINANIIATEDLERAIERPQDYGWLMIKVTGYSAHFVNLDPHYQAEIVKRTRQSA